MEATEIGPEGVDGVCEVFGAPGEITTLGALSAMGVPAVGLREGDLEADPTLDQEGDLLKRTA